MHNRIELRLFDRIFADEYRGVLALARRVGGCAMAEDIAQETFAALLRSGVDDPAHARRWLYRTALHRALDFIRRDRSRQERERHAAEPVAPEQPADVLERREVAEAVRRCLANIKPIYAAALSLKSSGFTYKEIAALLDVPIERVGVMLMRAESAIRKELDRDHASR